MPEKIVEKTIDYEGSLFTTIYDEEKNFYYCPICGEREKSPIFFKEEDLISHILSHYRRSGRQG